MRRLAMGLMVATFALLLLGACSDGSEEAAEMEAKRVKLLKELKELNQSLMPVLNEEREASRGHITYKAQIRGAKKSGNENLAAELQGKLDAAVAKWEALNKRLKEMEAKRDDMMDELRELGHDFSATGG